METSCQENGCIQVSHQGGTTTKPLDPNKNVKIEEEELERKKADYAKEQLKLIATTKINTFTVNYRIFTDESTDGKQPVEEQVLTLKTQMEES